MSPRCIFKPTYTVRPARRRPRVNSSPKDLNTLFEKMLDSVEPTGRALSRKMLLLALHNPFKHSQLRALDFSWLDDLETDDFPSHVLSEPYDAIELKRRYESVRRQLAAYTCGLLEMKAASGWQGNVFTVEFFHRTVRDYLKQYYRIGWGDGAPIKPEASIPSNELYLRILIARMKFFPLTIDDDFYLYHEFLLHHPNLFSYRWLKETEPLFQASFFRSWEVKIKHGSRGFSYSAPNTREIGSVGFFLLSRQAAYALHRIKDDLRRHPKKRTNGHISQPLLASWLRTIQDAEYFEFCLQNMLTRPSDYIQVVLEPTRSDPMEEMHSIWVTSLYAIAVEVHCQSSCLSSPNESLSTETLQALKRIIKCFIQHSADQSAVVIIGRNLDRGGGANWHDDSPPTEVFYVEIPDLLELLVAPDAITDARNLPKLSWREAIGILFPLAISRITTALRRERQQSILPVRSQFKPVSPEVLRDPNTWWVHGVATDTEKLLGNWKVKVP
jgi:hypothetical protein